VTRATEESKALSRGTRRRLYTAAKSSARPQYENIPAYKVSIHLEALMRPRRILLGAATTLAACTGGEPTTPSDVTGLNQVATFAISDGANGGNPYFFWAPPLAPARTPTGVFDGSLQPLVVVCAWNGSACTLEVARLVFGVRSANVRLDPTAELYVANWQTPAKTSPGVYRLTVLSGTTALGHADVRIAKAKSAGAYTPGGTIPIKFRIEIGALNDPTFDRVVTTQSNALQKYEDLLGSGVSKEQALTQTVAWVSQQPGVTNVVQSGSGAAITYADGTHGGFVLRETATDGSPTRGASGPAVYGGPWNSSPNLSIAGVATPMVETVGLSPDPSQHIGNRKVLVWSPFESDFTYPGIQPLGSQVATVLANHTPAFELTVLSNAAATMTALRSTMTQYGLVILDSHGLQGDVITGEFATSATWNQEPYASWRKSGALSAYTFPDPGPLLHWALTPRFFFEVVPGTFPNSVIIASVCESAYSNPESVGLWDALSSKGAGTFFGFDKVTSIIWSNDVTREAVQTLSTTDKTTGDVPNVGGLDPFYFPQSSFVLQGDPLLHYESSGPGYTILPVDMASATGINQNGYVVGLRFQTSTFTGFGWTESSGVGSIGVVPEDVNSRGEIVGEPGYLSNTAARITPTGVVQALPGLAPRSGVPVRTHAMAINDDGYVVGESQGLPVRWTPTNQVVQLSLPLGYNIGSPVGINASEQVVGSVSDLAGVNPRRTVLWDAAGNVRLLNINATGPFITARDINDAGQVVGDAGGFPNLSRAFVWQVINGQEVTRLLPPNRADALCAASAINNVGQAAGECLIDPDDPFTTDPFMWPVVWDVAAGSITVLAATPAVPGIFSGAEVTDINDFGTAAGRGYFPNGASTKNKPIVWQTR
jgi:hypothetical protein